MCVMSRIKARVGALTGVLVLAAGMAMTGAPPAAAAPSVRFEYERSAVYNNWHIYVYIDGVYAGRGSWYADPGEISTGDTLAAVDRGADGYGIEATLTNGRVATTRGHASPYEVYVSGDLEEDVVYSMQVCAVKGTYSDCSTWTSVHS